MRYLHCGCQYVNQFTILKYLQWSCNADYTVERASVRIIILMKRQIRLAKKSENVLQLSDVSGMVQFLLKTFGRYDC